jgi:PDDEXK-like domain of unknown function (DUF3799)
MSAEPAPTKTASDAVSASLDGGRHEDLATNSIAATSDASPSVDAGVTRLVGPGIYALPDEIYHAKFEPSTAARTDFGSAVHALLLGGSPICVIEADDFRKHATQAIRDEAYARGDIPLLARKYDTALDMAAVAREFMAVCGLDLSKGKTEQALIWREDTIWCRGKVDWVSDDLLTIVDYKTTDLSARPEDMGRSLYDQNYDLKAAFYERGLNVLDPDPRHVGRRRVLFFYQETTPPYACSIVQPSEAGMTLGRKQSTYAIRRWQDCMRSTMWPGYGYGVSSVSPPVWREKAWLEREESDEFATGETSPSAYVKADDVAAIENLED